MRNYFPFTLLFAALLWTGSISNIALAQTDQTQTMTVDPTHGAPDGKRAPRPGDAKAQIEFDLRELFRALNGLQPQNPENIQPIGDYLSGARAGFFGGPEWANYFVRSRGTTQFGLDKIEVQSLETDAARVKVFYSLTSIEPQLQIEGQPVTAPQKVVKNESETLDLKRETLMQTGQEKWRTVAPQEGDFPLLQPLSLRHIAYFGGQRAGTWKMLRGVISMRNLQQMALGAMQFAQDYDARFYFENEFWRDAIRPYVGDEAIFQIPGTRDFYTFNDKLSDQNLGNLKDSAQTVLFYEGQSEKPLFRYGGKAAIGFADGHAKLVSPDEAEDLRWKP